MHRVLKRSAAGGLPVLAVSLVFAGHVVQGGPTTSAYAQTWVSPTPTASCSADASGPGCGAGGTTSTPAPSGGSAGDCTWKEGGSSVVGIYGATAPPQSEWTWLSDAEYDAVVAWMGRHGVIGLGTAPYTSLGVVFCPDPTVVGVFTIGTLSTPPTAENVLGLWAVSQVAWNPPNVGTSPPVGAPAVVNLPTYLYLNPGAWQTFTATATAGGVSATVVAVPEQVVWTTGDGQSVTCPGQGVPYNSSYGTTPPSDACTYAYTATGTYTLSATVYYHATWTSTGAGGLGGDLGLVPGPTVTEQITVQQIASVITAG